MTSLVYGLLPARAAWKSHTPAAGASQGWASFHSELKTLLQEWKTSHGFGALLLFVVMIQRN